jgi:pimeloyl-ACP methyl ester carboxylesterase
MFDPVREARKIAFDRAGTGEPVLLLSGFPQTRSSWKKIVPLLLPRHEVITADLPSFGDSAILSVPATTENVGRIFHEFVATIGAPLHVVAHDFGAWVAFSWALMFADDFRLLTLIDAGIPGITLTGEIQLSDFKRKWNFIFQMLPDLPAALTKGKEDVYVGWWFKNKVHDRSAISSADIAGYAQSYAREGRMDAAMDYCRMILADMEFNKSKLDGKLEIPILAIGGEHSIPTMGEALEPYCQNLRSAVIPQCGHFVPEEQPILLVDSLLPFIGLASRCSCDPHALAGR